MTDSQPTQLPTSQQFGINCLARLGAGRRPAYCRNATNAATSAVAAQSDAKDELRASRLKVGRRSLYAAEDTLVSNATARPHATGATPRRGRRSPPMIVDSATGPVRARRGLRSGA